jgi:ABC-2 type transport system permease protein
MRNYFRLLWIHLRVGVMTELQYRVNFFVQLLQTAIALMTGLVVLSLVFTYTDSLRGWSRAELLIVMGVHILIGGTIKVIIQPNMMRLMDDIHQGSLDYTLTKPENAQLLVSVREVQFWQLVDVATGLVVIGWGLTLLEAGLTSMGSLFFLLMLLLAVILMYSFWLMFASVAFWVIRINDIILVWSSLYQAGRWPVGIYPSWLRLILTVLVPVAFAVTIPSEALTGRLSLSTLTLATALTAVIFTISHAIWRLGLRNYAGASA